MLMNYQRIVLHGYLECKPEQSAFSRYFERQAKIAERDEFVEKEDFYKECLSVIEKFQGEIYRLYYKNLTEYDGVLAAYRSQLKRGVTVSESGESIESHIENILHERKGKEERGYKNDTYFFWCGTDGDGMIVHDMLSLEHKLYYPILERMKDSINRFISMISEPSSQDNDSSPGNSESNSSHTNTNEPTGYQCDPGIISSIYQFCIDTNVFDNNIKLSELSSAVENANFKVLVEKCALRNKKSQCMYLITNLAKHIIKPDWYKETAHSINTEPTRLSGISIPSPWKKKLNDIK